MPKPWTKPRVWRQTCSADTSEHSVQPVRKKLESKGRRRQFDRLDLGQTDVDAIMSHDRRVYHSLDAVAAAEVTSMLQAFVVGILLHIGTTVLFEAGEGHTFNKAKFAATCAGLGLGLLAFA